MVSLFSIGFLKLYFRHEIPPYILFTHLSIHFSYHFRSNIQSPHCVVWLIQKQKIFKKNNFYWSLYSFLFGSLSYLKITLGIAMHCQHCNIIANRAPHSVIYFLHTAHKYSAFIPPFLRNHIICLFSSCCSPTLTVEHSVNMQLAPCQSINAM